jgi:DNA-directed RNA polymerase specialized sigma54-like protein
VTTRVGFDPSVLHAIAVRSLTIGELARQSRLSQATVSTAIHGKLLNVRSAVLLARTLAASPVITELEEWATSLG